MERCSQHSRRLKPQAALLRPLSPAQKGRSSHTSCPHKILRAHPATVGYAHLGGRAECLMKLSWSTIWEFQERLFQSWAPEDNVVLRNLQTSVKELTRKHWDLPPPGGQGHCRSPGDHAGHQGTASPDAVRIHIREPGQARPETLSPCSDEDVEGWLKGVNSCEHCCLFPASLLQCRQSAPRSLAQQRPECPSPLCQHGTRRLRGPACCTTRLLEALFCSLAPAAATAGTTAKCLPAGLPRGQRHPAVIASAAHTVKIVSSTFPCSHQRESLQRVLLILRWGKQHTRWTQLLSLATMIAGWAHKAAIRQACWGRA
ncbi:uncharacterized protein LOC124900389 isoform X2 [Homo sapiens]|uniref:uncharacterized protein LOC124900389 isoform X2 n=1 Tax=Homo sapiens TaxID=9606 RepID=UPI0005D00E20|nr:uncharacterized protein LOC124900389 isoform X2 [Homo sapiens]XP_054174098.1 uncharacterized protein LOC124900389 isoform X2 [Homo sapiens]|eukprot:XP_011522430.1 uncharacterized protein LOC105369205 isoform X2 [Homo sapiens]